MNFDLVRPCAHCPFRTDFDFGLRPERVREFAGSIAGGAAFPCHKTTEALEPDDDGEGGGFYPDGDSQMCAGAMIACMKSGGPNQLMRIAERLGKFDPDRLDMAAPVVSWAEQIARAAGEDEDAADEACCIVKLVGGMVMPAEDSEPTTTCCACGESVCEAECCSSAVDGERLCAHCAEDA